MPTPKQKILKAVHTDEVRVLEHDGKCTDIAQLIRKQLQLTTQTTPNQLQCLSSSIHMLTIMNKDGGALYLKRISDRVQYAILPTLYEGRIFFKASLNKLKNLCHASSAIDKELAALIFVSPPSCHINLYFELVSIKDIYIDALRQFPISIKATDNAQTLLLTSNGICYPVDLARIASLCVWQNKPLHRVVDRSIEESLQRFSLFPRLLCSLEKIFKECRFQLMDGHLRCIENSVHRNLDYANLLDDIIFAHQQDHMDDYLSSFRILDLLSTNSFPTVSVRSPLHLKARPHSLHNLQNGYAIAAANEYCGKQTAIEHASKKTQRSFSFWLNRSSRHLFRHRYNARVIFIDGDEKNTLSLVGEQAASIALFPGLIKGVFESLDLKSPKSARLIAHNEDVLTIAHDTASWVDINETNRRAEALFRLVANDGSDPLSLFEQVLLPSVGVGFFDLKVVPPAFFELLDTAHGMKHSLAPGHSHYLLGLAYECIHEFGMAISEFKKALRLDANDPDILHCLGSALMEMDQPEQSLPFLKRAFELLPGDAEVANNWGRSSMACGRLDDAIRAFQQAVKLSPGSAPYLKNLGDGYLKAERAVDALLVLRKAIRCDPYFAKAHESLAELHLSQGDEASAKKHALLAYKENPVDTNIANLLWRLTLGKKVEGK